MSTLKLSILLLACIAANTIELVGHEATSQKTPLFGTNKIGSAFGWTSSLENADIREVSGRKGWYIDQIKVRTHDGSREETSPSFGGNGGNPYTWKVPEGEYIVKIEYRQGDWLDGVTFVTNKGNKSPHFGGYGGKGGYTYTLPVGAKLNGLYGFKDQYIRGLGFTYKVHSTPEFGTNRIGSPFSWMSTLYNADIREVSGRDGWYIDQVKVKTADGSQEETSPSFGGNGGGPYTWTVPNGEYIAKIEYRQGSWLDGVTFVTNRGNRSPQFGGHGGSGPYTYTLPAGQRLAGIYGHKDAYIRGLGFFLAPAEEQDNHANRVVKKLPVHGNYNSGARFEWIAGQTNGDLSRVEGRAGWYIDKIKFYLNNGQQSPAYIGNGGNYYNHVIGAGQHVVSASFKTGSWLDSVTFKTNTGATFKIGGNGGSNVATDYIPAGASIVGLYGSHNGGYLLSLGLIIAE